MNVIEGDNVLWTKWSRTGYKYHVAKVLKINKDIDDVICNIEIETICNAHTGKKRKEKKTVNADSVTSLMEFIDEKRAFIKELEKYL